MSGERHFRAFARRAVSLPATVATAPTAAAGEAAPRAARLVNLGLGGACIEVTEALPVGSSVTLQVTAPNLWDPLVVSATVAWLRADPPGKVSTGLKFLHDERTALPALVELLSAYRYE